MGLDGPQTLTCPGVEVCGKRQPPLVVSDESLRPTVVYTGVCVWAHDVQGRLRFRGPVRLGDGDGGGSDVRVFWLWTWTRRVCAHTMVGSPWVLLGYSGTGVSRLVGRWSTGGTTGGHASLVFLWTGTPECHRYPGSGHIESTYVGLQESSDVNGCLGFGDVGPPVEGACLRRVQTQPPTPHPPNR